MKKIHFILSIILMSGLISCQSFKKSKTSKEGAPISALGQWESKAMIKSLETGDASVVSIDVLGQKPQRLRAEVTTTLGIALASVVMTENTIEYLVPKQKKFYQGRPSPMSLYPALKIKVHPQILMGVFFEEAYPQWNCQADHGMLTACVTPEGVNIKWERDEDGQKRVTLNASTYEVQIQIKSFKERSEIPENTWTLQVPSNFKRLKLK